MSTGLKHLPKNERPRERLLQSGVHALALSELIAILLSTGSKGESVLSLAQKIVSHFDTLSALIDASVEELMQFKGVGEAKAIQLKAAFGIAQKCLRCTDPKRPQINTAEEAYAVMKGFFALQKKEVLVVLLLDVKHRLITFETVAMGTLTEVLSHPREVFFPAVKHCAHSLILMHNHPSGDPTPSAADLKLTRELLAAARLLHIPLEDHIIVGHNSFTSFKERGGI